MAFWTQFSFIFIFLMSLSLNALTPVGQFLQDEKGAVIFLRGVNVSGASKTPPFTEKLKPEDLEPLRKWGVNTIRLVFIWEALEPKKGQYDEAYLTWFKSIVDAAGKYGLHVLIDFHQDAYSRFSIGGCGCGFPEWTVFNPVKPDNGLVCENWGDRQTKDEDMRKSFTDFYANKNGFRDSFLGAVKKLAQTFKNHKAVIGYDLINEPYGDWNEHLLPLYTDAEKVIHAEDASKTLFIEPSMGRLTIAGKSIQPVMTEPEFKNFAIAPHYYDLQRMALGRIVIDTINADLAAISDLSKKWNVPAFIGEFSLGRYSAEKEPENAAYVEKLYEKFNARLWSATQWVYTPTWNSKELDGWNAEDASISVGTKENVEFRSFRPRPTPDRIAGVPTAMTDKKTLFTLSWTNNPAAGETVVFAPKNGKYQLFKGDLEVSPKTMKCSYQADGQRISCQSSAKGSHRLTVR